MAWARVDDQGRIMEWCRDRLDGFEVEFSNGEEVDELCTDGLEDFIIEEGKAVFRPTAEKQVSDLKRKLEETDYIAAKAIESIIGAKDVVSLLSTLKRIGEEYAETLKRREEWRGRINELEGGE